MATFKYKIVITGEVDVGSITDADILRNFATYSNALELIHDEEAFQHGIRNRELLESMKTDEANFQLLVFGAALHEASLAIGEFSEGFGIANSEGKVVMKHLASAGPALAGYFNHHDEAMVYESIDPHFVAAFKGHVRKSVVTIERE